MRTFTILGIFAMTLMNISCHQNEDLIELCGYIDEGKAEMVEVKISQNENLVNRLKESWFEYVFGVTGNQAYAETGGFGHYYLDDDIFLQLQKW